MNISRIASVSLLAPIFLFVPACGESDDAGAHNIPEANAEAPLPPDTGYQGHHDGPPNFYRLDVPADYPHIVASLEYSLAELPAGTLSLELVREDVSSPDFGFSLAECYSYDDATESVALRHSFPDSAGGRYYLATFYTGIGIEGTTPDVDYTIRWSPMTTPEGGFELGCVP